MMAQCDRSRPVARIDRVEDEDDDDRIKQLQRAGLLVPAVESMPLELLHGPAPGARSNLLGALLEEREADR